MGYYMAGCFAEPLNARALPNLLLANDSMTVEKCLSYAKAALPSTTYGYVGLEYARECWAGTAAPPAPTQYVGSQACNLACKGNPSESCGAGNQFNLYVSNTVTFASTVTVSTVTKGTVAATPTKR